jgi:hypothetical protein
MVASSQLHAPATFASIKRARYPLTRRLCAPHTRSGRFGKLIIEHHVTQATVTLKCYACHQRYGQKCIAPPALCSRGLGYKPRANCWQTWCLHAPSQSLHTHSCIIASNKPQTLPPHLLSLWSFTNQNWLQNLREQNSYVTSASNNNNKNYVKLNNMTVTFMHIWLNSHTAIWSSQLYWCKQVMSQVARATHCPGSWFTY